MRFIGKDHRPITWEISLPGGKRVIPKDGVVEVTDEVAQKLLLENGYLPLDAAQETVVAVGVVAEEGEKRRGRKAKGKD